MQKHILIVEDEAAIRDMVAVAITRAGMQAVHAADVRSAVEAIAHKLPDLILLDWMLPGISGIEYARRLRKDELTRGIPIIMLTARSEEDDRVLGLDGGVDDYITKPFSIRELMARIKAVMRRAIGENIDNNIESAGLSINGAAHRVFADGKPVTIGPTEYKLLYFFMTHPDRVYARDQLLDRIWGNAVYVEERTIDVHIRRLRKTLEPFGKEALIQTVRGSGYRFSSTI